MSASLGEPAGDVTGGLMPRRSPYPFPHRSSSVANFTDSVDVAGNADVAAWRPGAAPLPST
jgi:hypothetical protein